MADAASGGLVESVLQLLVEFGRVAVGVDPLTTVLLVFGAVLTGVSVGISGYLAAGAVLDVLGDLIPTPSSPGGPPRDRE